MLLNSQQRNVLLIGIITLFECMSVIAFLHMIYCILRSVLSACFAGETSNKIIKLKLVQAKFLISLAFKKSLAKHIYTS